MEVNSNRKFKRLSAILVALMMVVGLIPGTAFAADGASGGSEVKLKVENPISVSVGETKTIKAEVVGTANPENYHVHWYYHGGKKNYEITDIDSKSVSIKGKGAETPSFSATLYEDGVCTTYAKDSKGCPKGCTQIGEEVLLSLTIIDPNPNLNPEQGGTDQGIQWISPELSETSENDSAYLNVIKESLNGQINNTFSFKILKQTGTWEDTSFINNGLSHIKILDASQGVVGTAENGKITYAPNTGTAQKVDITIHSLPEGEYYLLFEKEFNLRGKTLNKDIKFKFNVITPTPTVDVKKVTLDKTTMTLHEGAEEKLVATVKPDNATDKTVSWESSDSSIVKVGKKTGKLTAVSAGTATITATAGGKTATCTVTVDHDWAKATCMAPATCKVCGVTDGDALGHDWKAATCTAAKTCKVCGATEGSALGHDWKAATCTAAKTCNRCSVTEGTALGHDWADATCTEPKTCKRCKLTEGTANGHNTELVIEKAATCEDNGNKAYYECTVCNNFFSDAAATIAITKESVVTPAKGHKFPSDEYKFDENGHWHDGECEVCGKKDSVAAHQLIEIIDKQATTTETGLKHKECKICDYTMAQEEIPVITAPADQNQDKGGNNDASAQTGDDMNLMVWFALMLVALGGTSVVIATRKRRQ